MKSYIKKFIVIFSIVTFPAFVHSLESPRNIPIKIGSYLTPGLIEEDGSGMFNKLNKAIFDEINVSNELTLSSINRVRTGVNNGNLDIYFPELWENLPGNKKDYVVSDPIFYKRIILFTLKESPIKALPDFNHELIGVVQGFSYGKDITSNSHLNFSYQKNDRTNIKLLLNKRIGGVLGGFPGTVLAVNASQDSERIHYDLSKPVAVLESFYVCKNDNEGVKLCNSINKALNSLKKQGVLTLDEKTGFSKFTPKKNIS